MALDRVLARIRSLQNARAVAVFDLDSTLLSTAQRNLAILHEFAAASSAPPLTKIVDRLTAHDMGWNVMDDLRRHGYEDTESLRALKKFWLSRFFTDDYLRHDEPLPGAPEFVRDVHDAGAIVVYLTGRDEPGMGRGTRDSLRSHRFPIDDPRVLLRLKPTFNEDDLVFKRRATAEIAALGTVLAAFENEPANANYFAERFPEADVVLLETVHSPNPPPLLPHITRLRDFTGRAPTSR
jgi:hypothetical protein